MYGIGSYHLDASGLNGGTSQYGTSPAGAGGSNGASTSSGVSSVINAVGTGLSSIVMAFKGEGGGMGPYARGAAPPPSGGLISNLMPILLVGAVVVGGYFLIKRLRRKA